MVGARVEEPGGGEVLGEVGGAGIAVEARK